jgi:hypothetical protein
MGTEPRGTRRFRLLVIVVVVVLAWVAAGIVIPNEGFAIVGISRFTDSVSLVQGGCGRSAAKSAAAPA